MTKSSVPLSDLVEKQGNWDFLRAVAEAVLQLSMETDVEDGIRAGRDERSDGRTTWCNGYFDRTLDTRFGTLNRRVPKPLQGSYSAGFLEPRKTSEKAPGRARHYLSDQWRDNGSLQEAGIGAVHYFRARTSKGGPGDFDDKLPQPSVAGVVAQARVPAEVDVEPRCRERQRRADDSRTVNLGEDAGYHRNQIGAANHVRREEEAAAAPRSAVTSWH